MKALVLEDNSFRIRSFKQRFLEYGIVGEYTEFASEAIRLLSEKKYDIIFLDHDLGGEVYVDTNNKNTGSEVARWINKNPQDAVIILHTLNEPAAENMKSLIKASTYIPFVWDDKYFCGVAKYLKLEKK